MSRQQKGRRHRTVNRRPRPVGSGTPQRRGPAAPVGGVTDREVTGGGVAAEEAPVQGVLGVGAPDVEVTDRQVTDGAVSIDGVPVVGVTGGEAPAGGAAVAREEAGPLFSQASKDGGLGLPAARTWRQLALAGSAGATVEDLSSTVGYQPPTIVKHLRGLSRYGMADQQGSRWRPTGKSQWEAAEEHGLALRPMR